MSPQSRSRLLFLALVVALAALVFYPFEVTVAPEWHIKVINQEGKPVEGMIVREVWQHYSVETSSHEQDIRSDEYGVAMFPRRTKRISLVGRILGHRKNLSETGIHASFGPHAYVIVFGKGLEGGAEWDEKSESMRSEIVVKPVALPGESTR